jgi:osmotically-inducible protein OsmY
MPEERQPDTSHASDTPVPGDWSTLGRSASPPGADVPDERIREDVCDRLMQFGPVDCTAVDVSVAAGIVTIRGSVGNWERGRIEEVVRSVKGVRDIDNQLRLV